MRFISNWINANQDVLAAIVVCAIVFLLYNMKEKQRKISFWGMWIYVAFVLYETVLSRKNKITEVKLELGWSYRSLLQGNRGMLSQIYLNIMLFVPIGIFSEMIFQNKRKGSRLFSILFGLILSISVEFLQLTLHCGTFELDDMLNNTIGTIVGILIAGLLKKSNTNL